MTKLTKSVTYSLDSSVDSVMVFDSTINNVCYNFVSELLEDIETGYFFKNLVHSGRRINIKCYDNTKTLNIFTIDDLVNPSALLGRTFDKIYINDTAIKEYCKGKGQMVDILTEIVSLCQSFGAEIIFVSNLT